MHPNAWIVLQMAVAMLCAASAFGVILSAMATRGRLPAGHPQTAIFDIAHTARTYQLASILASIGAMASISNGYGAFAAFLGVAVSFQLAENWLLPRMLAAGSDGDARRYHGIRSRLELIQSATLSLIFINIGIPPLVTLANVYGLR